MNMGAWMLKVLVPTHLVTFYSGTAVCSSLSDLHRCSHPTAITSQVSCYTSSHPPSEFWKLAFLFHFLGSPTLSLGYLTLLQLFSPRAFFFSQWVFSKYSLQSHNCFSPVSSISSTAPPSILGSSALFTVSSTASPSVPRSG